VIRRDDHGDWLIIPQNEHARIAGELARAWGNERFASQGLLFGVERHDAGWRLWDEAPQLDAFLAKHPRADQPLADVQLLHLPTGIPRSFMDMRMRDSTAIWSQSIAHSGVDPLAGIGVSRHFCNLARLVKAAARTGREDCDAIEVFLDEQARVEAQFAERARLQYGAAKSAADLERLFDFAFQTVRFFDAVSLWLCCEARTQPQRMMAPTGEAITLIPKDPPKVAIDPYPLAVEELHLETPVRRIRARKYADEADYRQAFNAAPVEKLSWLVGRDVGV
jgi:Protein of unknown function (DUF3891)